jgi:hypothetical protein
MAVRVAALHAGLPLLSGSFLVNIPRVVVCLEGLGKSENAMTSPEIEPATFPLVTVRQQPLAGRLGGSGDNFLSSLLLWSILSHFKGALYDVNLITNASRRPILLPWAENQNCL